MELAKDIQDGARDLARLLPASDGEEPLRRIAQLHEQLDGLTAAVVGRARYRRLTWSAISSTLRISEDTARHRYTERYILRRLARFNRSETPLTSLAGLFNNPVAPAADSPEGPAGSDAVGESRDSGSERGDGSDQSVPVESSGAAYNRLAPILSMLIRTAQLTNKEVSGRIGCSASYLSRILSGERVPTWALTRKVARTCGADPEVLRTVWESEKLSEKNREPAVTPDEAPMPAAERLRTAVHTLHLRAGRPAPNDIAVASGWLLSAGAVASILEATVLPHHDLLEAFVRVLGGDVDRFKQLLDAARREATEGAALLRPSSSHSATAAATGPSTTAESDADPHPTGPDAVMETFSEVLLEEQTVEDGRARLLAKQQAHARPPGGHQPRLPTTTVEALRHRPPTHHILPLRAGS
ncbi:helix-turn-helix domain-containing protein [Streptomyces djakartensis]|nr:helix-turn-helix transcriptional regulator [Streptomyces djakartensis]